MSLPSLPYDLLLNIAQYLDLDDVNALQMTCKSLHDFSHTRSVYRNLAYGLLYRCRALPLKGFQRLSDLTTDQLIHSVHKAAHYEESWRVRAPRPITVPPFSDGRASTSLAKDTRNKNWYKVVTAPPGEEVDWLSPITSSYTLCATKSGKVVCWDVQTDMCLAEWNPGERWELWKCRVEFEDRTVFFTMAKVLEATDDDERVMEFVLMRLYFPDAAVTPFWQKPTTPTPIFSHVTNFKTTGVVMNVFLLDPPGRLLSAFVWISSTNTIGLYALLDWDKPNEFVFINTEIVCQITSNWSCILYEDNIVIHSEESDDAFQHFYPLSLLRQHLRKLDPESAAVPVITGPVSPSKTITKKFLFPPSSSESEEADLPEGSDIDDSSLPMQSPTLEQDSSSVIASEGNPNPFPFPPWYPESAHFVRQWWPTLPGVPRLSCTVVLLAEHDPVTHITRFVLAQHYFQVPLSRASLCHSANKLEKMGHVEDTDTETETELNDGVASEDDALMRIWYVSTPFEVVCVSDTVDEDIDQVGGSDRPRPLVAVDFGHAVWIEYFEEEDDEDRADRAEGQRKKWLRFVTFPSVGGGKAINDLGGSDMDGNVRTLDVPDELDLDTVETINIDQSQGAVILSVKEGKIFILCYE